MCCDLCDLYVDCEEVDVKSSKCCRKCDEFDSCLGGSAVDDDIDDLDKDDADEDLGHDEDLDEDDDLEEDEDDDLEDLDEDEDLEDLDEDLKLS